MSCTCQQSNKPPATYSDHPPPVSLKEAFRLPLAVNNECRWTFTCGLVPFFTGGGLPTVKGLAARELLGLELVLTELVELWRMEYEARLLTGTGICDDGRPFRDDGRSVMPACGARVR